MRCAYAHAFAVDGKQVFALCLGRFSVLEPMAQKIGKRKAEAIVTGHSPAGEEKDIA